MKITCKQRHLSQGLSIVDHAISTRSTLPILANILLTTGQGCLKLSSTNLEIGITCWVEAEIHEEGITTIPAKTITDLVSSLRQENIELSVSESHTMTIRCRGSHCIIKGVDPSEFPLLPDTEGDEPPISLESRLLKEMIAQVAFAAATEETRPVLTAIHVEIHQGQLTFAAADSFRLATRRTLLSEYDDAIDPLLIPARTLVELARILPTEGNVEMIVTPNRSQVLFRTENIALVSRLIEGSFPNFHQLIPGEYTTRAVIETEELAAAIKTVIPFARDSSNITILKIARDENAEPGTGTLTLEATAEEIGSNVSTVNAFVDGPPQQVIFNVKYLSDILAVLPTPEVALEITSSSRPGVLKSVGAFDCAYVIMPMHVNR